MSVDDEQPAIRVEGVGKRFRRVAAGHKLRTLKSALVERSLIGGLRPEESITALEGIDFTVVPGQAVGLIGSNGSGKSTLLKMVAGILRPTEGTITVNGRVAALIELGAGFHPEISGRENIYINGAVLGLSRREIDRRLDDIVAFAGLEDFIEEPVKNYSSGMYVRLGFAVAIHTDPDVLLVDEVLAVGDEAFAHKCLHRIEAFLAAGKTLLVVSHSLSLIENLCDTAIWLEKGILRAAGHPRRVVDAYRQAVAEDEGRAHRAAKEQREYGEEADAPVEVATATDDEESTTEEAETEPAELLRWGSGEVEIVHARMRVDGEERYHVPSSATVEFEIDLQAKRAFDDFVFGIAINTPRGFECWGTNTDLEGLAPEELPSGASRVTIRCPSLRLGAGAYQVDLAVHARDGTPYDYRRQLMSFSVTAPHAGVGVYAPEHAWTFSPSIRWRDQKA